ncbi:2-dehydropantoate 2-reductase [Bernardetia litoralis DSM 6794]|uniref:2-dehydropantoate 2-reductase n=1 Tax=Bernardetia litoralis (strain ATCC 23117 / DSM 6794 / NBRC 15988 / NCIMB 1366 / Fx l1 / Sio-4) TaxID=880071 RepID=I4AL18_BERLS|nr:2-dehydropantoate 2-reductase [Bernardetia litoralis]AFM04653.1 2-dehydropantoate 2-reductase [Bernardetia litoralis DSM 6794]
MNISIIGLGGVGGYFGFKINQSNEKSKKHHISFVGRTETYRNIKEKGLQLLSSEHENNVTIPNAVYQNIAEIKNPDLVLICVKEYDLENVCKQLNEVITDDCIILPMMNGVDIYDRIRKVLPNNTILSSCVYVASHIKQKGVIEHKGKAGKLIYGRDPKHFSKNVDWIETMIKDSGINYEFKDDALADIWTKFIFIASFGLVTAKYNSSMTAVCTDKKQKQEASEIMEEIKLIAKKKNITISENIINATFEKAATFPVGAPTSLQLDINSEKKNNELELFAGAIIKYGADFNVKCPFTQKIYTEIKTASSHRS